MSADEHRPSAAERHHELAMAAISRAPQPPEHTVGLTLNAKGDVQIEVTGRGHDLPQLVADVTEHFGALVAKYPRAAPDPVPTRKVNKQTPTPEGMSEEVSF